MKIQQAVVKRDGYLVAKIYHNKVYVDECCIQQFKDVKKKYRLPAYHVLKKIFTDCETDLSRYLFENCKRAVFVYSYKVKAFVAITRRLVKKYLNKKI